MDALGYAERDSITRELRGREMLGYMRIIFLDAMQSGYIASPSEEFPGAQRRSYTTKENWEVVEVRFGEPVHDRRFGGLISISYCGVMAWTMHYFGEHHDGRTANCISAACEEAYQSNLFLGGRGPLNHEHQGLLYVNDPEGDFDSFYGFERVFDPANETFRGRLIGWCHYQGGLLV